MNALARFAVAEAKDFFSIGGVLNEAKMYLKQYAIGKLKEAFGKEFYLTEDFSHSLKRPESEPLFKFFCSFIKDFEKKYIDSLKNLKPIVFERIDQNTFIYIASDIFIPNKALSNAIRKGDLSRDSSRSIYDANMYIYIFGKKSPKYSKLLERILEEISIIKQKKKIAIVTELSYDSTDISTLSFDPRDMNTLAYSFNEMEIIKNHLDKFVESYSFYKYKQLLYKTGILLYGVPGTGKSTICKVLANLYQRNIIQVNIPTIEKINFGELTRLINNDDAKYIVLLEDIDTLYLNRDSEKVDKDYNNIINNLLQFLDSNTSPNDVIFIATTNHVDRLDEALLRAGRFDLKVEIKGLLEKDIDKMLDLFNLDRNLRKEVIKDYYNQEADEIYVNLYNQSKLQNILLHKIKVMDAG